MLILVLTQLTQLHLLVMGISALGAVVGSVPATKVLIVLVGDFIGPSYVLATYVVRSYMHGLSIFLLPSLAFACMRWPFLGFTCLRYTQWLFFLSRA